jgi:hypothetical protein
MTTYRVPSRTHAGHFYDVTISLDGTPICSCPASFHAPRITCWHVKYVKEEMMTNENTTALVPVMVEPSVALLPTARDLDLIDRAAAMVWAGAVALPPALNSQAKVAAVMLFGLELGLRPMTAIQHLYIINGKVSASAQVMAGMCMSKEKDISFHVEQLNATICTIRMIRPSRNVNEVYTVTWEQIKRAGLDKSDMNSKYPEDRLTYHCTKRLCRVNAPDLINNLDDGVPLAGLGGETTWREEPPIDPSELYNPGDNAALPPPAPPVVQDEITVAYMDLVSKHGTEAGRAVFDWAETQYPHAKPPRGKFSKALLTAAENAALFAEIKRYLKTGVARCPNEAHEPQYNDDTTLMACSICGLELEEAPVTGQEPASQPAFVT